MTLEDRIRDTGEHLLGSLEHRPDLPQRIHQRVEHRAHQRRQRAAAGLGAGVVVVLGGLVVLNVDRDGTSPGLAAPPSTPSISSMIASTTAVLAPTTTLPASSSYEPVTTLAPATTPVEAAPATVVVPLGDGAPTLYTATLDRSEQWGIDLASGLPAGVDRSATPTSSASLSPASGSTFELDRADPTAQDRCGQDPIVATVAGGETITGFPTHAAEMTLSRDGSTGLIRYASCPEAGTLAVDGPPSQAAEWQLAWFRTDDPAAVLNLLSGSWGELSDDGRYILLEDSSRAPAGIVDTGSGTSMPLLPDGCESPRKDPDTGYLIGTDGSAALAWCDGHVSLVAGPIGAATVVRSLDGCGENSSLSVLDPTIGSFEQNWFAVTDNDAKRAWVVGGEVTSEAIPVADLVAWHPLGAA